MMKYLSMVAICGVAACGDTTSSSGSFSAGAQPQGAVQAYFQGYPDALFEGGEAVCSGPGQMVVRPNPNEVRCESLPDPASAAALILEYNGTVENLPRFVIAFTGQSDQTGYLVTADSYIRVPGRDGQIQQLRFPDDRIAAEFTALLKTAGGRPL
ncbi:hypothetical protein [Pseudooctadecabacter jejudonensis]|uniref:Lipoprotein n=1 Tax=Pseudooctadecabacter jejudonensis TaxID=1391910 RepID=A0A1Y5RCH4_9RHOB|nr:hypothetical protein [Pseudooctadecabacter jejudonensis]SLN13005.1 hypothetical protein PSJ8397_00203 [Pseudooctadecabacter jejudonensis]